MSNIDKNNAIRESIRATRIKRKSQTCKTFKFKVDNVEYPVYNWMPLMSIQL